MKAQRVSCVIVLAGLLVGLLSPSARAWAEWYVAGQLGVTFADRLTHITGTGSLTGLAAPDFDLKNSLTYGAKLGYFPQHGWLGFELDAFQTTPHIKNLDDIPGIHFRVTSVGVNLLARYPGLTYQPYLGIGPAILIGHIGDSATTQSDSDVTVGLNALAGIRAFLTPSVALFTEYKYNQATFRFSEAFGPVGGFEGNYRVQHVLVGVSYHF